MKRRFANALVAMVLCGGCSTQDAHPVAGPDYSYRAIREELKGQPTPVPTATPYDKDEGLRSIFLSGFNKGWTVAREYWLGNAIAVPEGYQKSPDLKRAWQDGVNAGQQALSDRVSGIAASKRH